MKVTPQYQNVAFNNMDTVIQYYQWKTVIVERKDKKDLRTPKKMMKKGTIEEVIKNSINLLCNFSIHNLININKLHNFKMAKKNLKPNELIIGKMLVKIKV